MSIQYLSFSSIAELHNNDLLTTSPIGELSNKARTYAKDPGVFSITSGTSPTILFNFRSTEGGQDIQLPEELAVIQINVCNWIYGQAKIGNVNDNRGSTLTLLRTQFTNNIEITNIGEMVTNNRVWLPSFIEGKLFVDSEEHHFTIWMAEEYFRSQYPYVTFTIVHPIPLEEFDTLMEMNYQQIQERFYQETPDIIERRTKQLTNQAEWPYTERKVIDFDILDLLNKPNRNIGYWRYVEWGNGEDAEDQLFEQMQDEILANSKYPREDWEEKIPDLFNPLEFYMLPEYGRKGLINKVNNTSQYSPIGDIETQNNLMDFYIRPHMPEEHVIKSFQTVPWLFKSMLTGVVSKVNNREGRRKFHELYPDYSLIPSMDSDFGQMSANTGEMIRNMSSVLAAGESTTDISIPPMGIIRVERLGKMWVSRRINNVRFLVMTRYQMIQDGLVDG